MKGMNLHISDTNLSVRALNILCTFEIKSVYDLINFDVRRLSKARNCGKKTFNEIEDMQKQLQKIDNDIKKIMFKS